LGVKEENLGQQSTYLRHGSFGRSHPIPTPPMVGIPNGTVQQLFTGMGGGEEFLEKQLRNFYVKNKNTSIDMEVKIVILMIIIKKIN